MSFKLLKQVIAHLKKTSSCPFCKTRFIDDSFLVLATSVSLTGVCAGLFLVMCPKCSAQAFAMVEIGSAAEKLKKEFIRIRTKPTSPNISANEILDMHNFLKSWQGDVK